MADAWERAKPLNKRWLGLGTYSAYKSAVDAGYMAWHDGEKPPPRCMGWLVLTDAGIKAMKSCEVEFKATLDIMMERGYARTLSACYMLAGGLRKR